MPKKQFARCSVAILGAHCFSWLSAVFDGSGVFFATISSGRPQEIAQELWDVIKWSRSGRRGVSQKSSFIKFGLEAGYLSNKPPYIIQESYIGDYPEGVSVRREVLDRYLQSSNAGAEAESSEVVAVEEGDEVLPGSSTDLRETPIETPDSSSVVRSPKRSRTDRQFSFSPKHPSQQIYRISTEGEAIRQESLSGSFPVGAKLLLVDWHQVLDRSRAETAFEIERVPKSNLRLLYNLIQFAEGRDKPLLIGILSYIDTDYRVGKTLQSIRNTTGLSGCVNFLAVVRKDKVGREGKAALIADLLESSPFSESSVALVDDNREVIEETFEYLPQVQLVHIKLKRKPSVNPEIRFESFLEDAGEVLKQWIAVWKHQCTTCWGRKVFL